MYQTKTVRNKEESQDEKTVSVPRRKTGCMNHLSHCYKNPPDKNSQRQGSLAPCSKVLPYPDGKVMASRGGGSCHTAPTDKRQ